MFPSSSIGSIQKRNKHPNWLFHHKGRAAASKNAIVVANFEVDDAELALGESWNNDKLWALVPLSDGEGK